MNRQFKSKFKGCSEQLFLLSSQANSAPSIFLRRGQGLYLSLRSTKPTAISLREYISLKQGLMDRVLSSYLRLLCLADELCFQSILFG